MNELVDNTANAREGRVKRPYDSTSMSNYELTSTSPMDSFQIVIEMTGNNYNDYKATVSKYYASKPSGQEYEELGTESEDSFQEGSSLTVDIDNHPRDLVITRKENSRLAFLYGNPADDSDHLAWFAFDTEDFGFNKDFDQGGKYCKKANLLDSNAQVTG